MISDLSQKFVTNELCAHTSIGDKSIILNLKNGQYYELNSSSSIIWKLINEGKSVAEIISTISNEYDVANKDISASVSKFIKSCIELDFIQEKNDPK